jgi:hypothetical protein
MRRARKNSWEGEQWILVQEKGECDKDENEDKRIVMMELIIQE